MATPPLARAVGGKLTLEHVKKLHKCDLHRHRGGTFRPELIWELAKKQGKQLVDGREWKGLKGQPITSVEQLRAAMTCPADCPSLAVYLEYFLPAYAVTQTKEALYAVNYDACKQAHEDGLTYLELRMSIGANRDLGLTIGDVLEATCSAIAKANVDFAPFQGRILVTVTREKEPSLSAEVAQQLKSWLKKEAKAEWKSLIVGLDLAGSEDRHPPLLHQCAFTIARTAGLHLTIHAGEVEEGGPSYIWSALRAGAERLGHGTAVFRDEELKKQVKELQIPLEMCLTSNVLSKAIKKLEDHPIRALFEAGCRTCLCTDNPGLCGSTLSEEYVLLQNKFGFKPWELVKVADYGFKSAFVSLAERVALRSAALANAIDVFGQIGVGPEGLDIAYFEAEQKRKLIVLPAGWDELKVPKRA